MRRLSLLLAALLPAACGENPQAPAESIVSVVAQNAAYSAGDFSSCHTCHGGQLEGNEAVGGPALAGLPAWYLEGQLRAFQAGWRGTHADDQTGNLMYRTALQLDEASLAAAVEYVGGFQGAAFGALGASGEGAGALYAEACAACHGEQGEGNQDLAAPPLAGMPAWYLTAQMTKFASGLRGTHPDDAAGATMAAAAQAYPDADYAALAVYLAGAKAS